MLNYAKTPSRLRITVDSEIYTDDVSRVTGFSLWPSEISSRYDLQASRFTDSEVENLRAHPLARNYRNDQIKPCCYEARSIMSS